MGRRRRRRKKKSKKDGDDKSTIKALAKSNARKENKIQKLSQSAEEAQKGMLGMANELRKLRGLPEVIQKQFEEQQKTTTGNDNNVPEPLMTMSQWKALLESNKKASSLSPAPVKAGLFTTACKKIKAT